jgi:hypothetical protein
MGWNQGIEENVTFDLLPSQDYPRPHFHEGISKHQSFTNLTETMLNENGRWPRSILEEIEWLTDSLPKTFKNDCII